MIKIDTEKVKIAIERLRAFEPEDGYYLAYSGGKDSDCIKILAYLACVKFEAVHNLTTADAPETVYYIKNQSDVRIESPELSMWQLIVKKLIPPTMVMRYCCSELKERGGKGKVVVTGVRWAESAKRQDSAGLVKILGKPKSTQKLADEKQLDYRINKMGGLILNDDNDENRRFVEQCYRTRKTLVNPIVDWSDQDVWEFLNHYGCDSNPLYQCGFKRIGCIGCPMSGKHRYFEFERYPRYKALYIKAFDRMLKARDERGLTNRIGWKTGKDVFKWWMGEDPLQLTFEELEMLKNGQNY